MSIENSGSENSASKLLLNQLRIVSKEDSNSKSNSTEGKRSSTVIDYPTEKKIKGDSLVSSNQQPPLTQILEEEGAASSTELEKDKNRALHLQSVKQQIDFGESEKQQRIRREAFFQETDTRPQAKDKQPPKLLTKQAPENSIAALWTQCHLALLKQSNDAAEPAEPKITPKLSIPDQAISRKPANVPDFVQDYGDGDWIEFENSEMADSQDLLNAFAEYSDTLRKRKLGAHWQWVNKTSVLLRHIYADSTPETCAESFEILLAKYANPDLMRFVAWLKARGLERFHICEGESALWDQVPKKPWINLLRYNLAKLQVSKAILKLFGCSLQGVTFKDDVSIPLHELDAEQDSYASHLLLPQRNSSDSEDLAWMLYYDQDRSLGKESHFKIYSPDYVSKPKHFKDEVQLKNEKLAKLHKTNRRDWLQGHQITKDSECRVTDLLNTNLSNISTNLKEDDFLFFPFREFTCSIQDRESMSTTCFDYLRKNSSTGMPYLPQKPWRCRSSTLAFLNQSFPSIPVFIDWRALIATSGNENQDDEDDQESEGQEITKTNYQPLSAYVKTKDAGFLMTRNFTRVVFKPLSTSRASTVNISSSLHCLLGDSLTRSPPLLQIQRAYNDSDGDEKRLAHQHSSKAHSSTSPQELDFNLSEHLATSSSMNQVLLDNFYANHGSLLTEQIICCSNVTNIRSLQLHQEFEGLYGDKSTLNRYLYALECFTHSRNTFGYIYSDVAKRKDLGDRAAIAAMEACRKAQ